MIALCGVVLIIVGFCLLVGASLGLTLVLLGLIIVGLMILVNSWFV